MFWKRQVLRCMMGHGVDFDKNGKLIGLEIAKITGVKPVIIFWGFVFKKHPPYEKGGNRRPGPSSRPGLTYCRPPRQPGPVRRCWRSGRTVSLQCALKDKQSPR